jgi:hypothetical protein
MNLPSWICRTAPVLAVAIAASSTMGAACSRQSGGGPAPGPAPAPGAATPAAPVKGERISVPGSGAPAAPASAPDAPAAPDPSFQLSVVPPPAQPIGTETTARVEVKPGPGYKINREFPTKLSLTAPEGVTVPKLVFELGDAAKVDDHQLTFDVKLTAGKPGAYQITGKLKFAVCTEESCDPKSRNIGIAVTAL